TFDGNPVVFVVSRSVGEEADMVSRDLAAIAILLQKPVETFAHQRACAVPGVLRNQEDCRRALCKQIVRLTFRWKALLFQLLTHLDGGFQLTACFGAGRRGRKAADLSIVIAVMTGERKIEDV